MTTAAARAVLKYGFSSLRLNRIYAFHLVGNAASARVLAKLNFQPEGVLRERIKKKERFYDVKLLSLLKRDIAERRLTRQNLRTNI